MEAIVAEGATFEHAHELLVSTVRPAAKSVGNKSGGNSGSGSKESWRSGDSAWRKSKFFAEERKAASDLAGENRMIMVVINGKSRFVRQSEYRQQAA